MEEKLGVKIPFESAPLAIQEAEEDDSDIRSVKAGMKQENWLLQTEKHEKIVTKRKTSGLQTRQISHPCLSQSSPDLPFISTFTITTTATSFSCSDFLNRSLTAHSKICWPPRKTVSAPSVMGDGRVGIEEPVEAVNTGPVVKKPTAISTALNFRISPPAYLSPQPSRMLRHLKQSSFTNKKVRPTSVSVSSMEHELQKLSRMGGSVRVGGYAPPPWARHSTTDLPPTPQVHVTVAIFPLLQSDFYTDSALI